MKEKISEKKPATKPEGKKKIKANVSEKKIKVLSELVRLMNSYNTIMISLIENISSAQFQRIKKILKEKAVIKVIKKNLVLLALEKVKEMKHGIEILEKSLAGNFAVIFSNYGPFELASFLAENKTKGYIKPGYIVKENIVIEAGPTDLPAGPMLSELAKAGIKATIEGGKIAVRERCVVAKKGEPVSEESASVLQKLEIMPLTISLEPIIAYDTKDKKIYSEIKVDKEKTLAEMLLFSSQAFSLALNISYSTNETIKFIIAKANNEANALQNKINQINQPTQINQPAQS